MKNKQKLVIALIVIVIVVGAVLLFMLGKHDGATQGNNVRQAQSTNVSGNSSSHQQPTESSSSKQPAYSDEQVAVMALTAMQSGTVDDKLNNLLHYTTEDVDLRHDIVMAIQPEGAHTFRVEYGVYAETVDTITIDGDTVRVTVKDMNGQRPLKTFSKAALIGEYRSRIASINEIIQRVNYNTQHKDEINQKSTDEIMDAD